MTYIGSRRFPRFSAHIKWLIWEWTFNLAIPSPAWVRKLCILNNLNFFTLPNVLNWLITIVQGLIRSVTYSATARIWKNFNHLFQSANLQVDSYLHLVQIGKMKWWLPLIIFSALQLANIRYRFIGPTLRIFIRD